MSSCPVCKNKCGNLDTTCLVCGFPQLNRVFVNSADAELWILNTVEPCRAIWKNACKRFDSTRQAEKRSSDELIVNGMITHPRTVKCKKGSSEYEISNIRCEVVRKGTVRIRFQIKTLNSMDSYVNVCCRLKDNNGIIRYNEYWSYNGLQACDIVNGVVLFKGIEEKYICEFILQ